MERCMRIVMRVLLLLLAGMAFSSAMVTAAHLEPLGRLLAIPLSMMGVWFGNEIRRWE